MGPLSVRDPNADADLAEVASAVPGSIEALAQCGDCGHFASIHHGGGGGRPGGASCAAPDCDCRMFVESADARVPLGKDNLTGAEVAQSIGLSVHTLSYWRQSNQGPKAIRAGTRTLYRRRDVEQWLAEVDGRFEPVNERRRDGAAASVWFDRAVEAAGRIAAAHTSPWKLASTYALLSIAESLLPRQHSIPARRGETRPAGPDVGLLTVVEVAEMTRVSVGTLRYWRHVGTGGTPSFKLGRKVMYRRAEVEKWLGNAR